MTYLNSPMRASAIRIHSLLNQAQEAPEDKKPRAYYIVFRGMLFAHKDCGVRADINKRFEDECPTGKAFDVVRARYRKEILGLMPEKSGKPLRTGRAQRQRERAATQRRIALMGEALQPPA